jgi:pectin methylesterase-like acyl-CoA thioesterase
VTATGETQTAVPRTNTEVDSLGGAVTSIGGRARWVYYTPVKIEGNVAIIKLHDGKLAYNTAYYVTIDEGVLTGTIHDTAFTGVTDPAAWTFTTGDPPSSYTEVTVSADGSADFRSVQGALDWIMEHCAAGASATFQCNTGATPKQVRISNGVYEELLFLRGVDNLTLSGESRHGARIQYDNFENYNPGTGGSSVAPLETNSDEGTGTRRRLGGGRAVLLIEGGDLVKLSRFTLYNTHVKATGINNQAETIYFNSSVPTGSRFIATYMDFLSTQDTIQTKGWAWFYRSLIEGDVDFLWGSPFAALFEQSEIRTVVDTTNPTSGGYVMQSRAFYGYPGFVVLDSRLTRQNGVPDNSTYLARSAGVGTNGFCSERYTTGSITNIHLLCDEVAYIRTRMGEHIKSVGWLTTPLPNQPPTETTGWRESSSTDLRCQPLDLNGRDTTNASHSLDLSGLDTRTKVFASWNNGAGWIPAP